MTDTRPRVPLNGKRIDLAQLTAEVGTGLCADEDEVVVADPDSTVTATQLKAALTAHAPAPVEPVPTLAELAAEVRGMRERAAAVSATGAAAAVRDAITGPAR